MIEHATDWRTAGACLTADPDLFFPIAVGTVASSQIARAQRICATCAVRQQCLDFALRTRESTGIWGGTTPEERIRVLRGRHRGPAHRLAPEMPQTRAS
jgi:WhiB family redox-sensing transcriptional regulator